MILRYLLVGFLTALFLLPAALLVQYIDRTVIEGTLTFGQAYGVAWAVYALKRLC